MDTKKLYYTLPFVFAFCLVLLFVSALQMVSYAEGLPETDEIDTSIVQDEQLESAEPPRSGTLEVPELVQAEQSDTETPQSEIEYIPFEKSTPQDYITINYEHETLLTLKSIEYQLKIIAGGVILAVIFVFIRITILNPIKRFTSI